MALLEQWRKTAYSETADKQMLQKLWNEYFLKEKDIYAELLKNPDEVVTGTVKELADKYHVDVMTMTIIMQTMCLQAGARKHHISLREQELKKY